MKPSNIVQLESYRGRRETRLRRALVLNGYGPWRRTVLSRLRKALALADGDRAGLFWLDEYGPGLAHPFMLLDLASDRPRRSVSSRVLRETWETGVPGMLDMAEALPLLGGEGEGTKSLCAVTLGSDGFRSWFMVVDSLTPRPPLSGEAAGELMFLAGELASVILHGEIPAEGKISRDDAAEVGITSEPNPGFAGWPVLKDIEGRRDDEEANRRITARFLVARFLRGLLDDQLVSDGEALSYQLNGIRSELESVDDPDREKLAWVRLLKGAEAGSIDELLAATLEWGRLVEGQGHLNGALEIHGMAHELAVLAGSADGAIDAARFTAKVLRTRAEWDQAEAWYDMARVIAQETGDRRRLAVVLDGMANTLRDRGNLPRAREVLHDVLALGLEGDDRYARAIAHHDLMTVEKLSGNMPVAIRHGWDAAQSYDSPEGRLRALFDLAGVLRETGELGAARDAYTVVATQVQGFEYRILALDALAYLAALKGDGQEHRRLRSWMDSENWREASPVYRAQILFYRGLSERALGNEAVACRWLRNALACAEEHGLSKLIFDTEEALRVGERKELAPQPPLEPSWTESEHEDLLEVRCGLKRLRETQVGAV